MPTTGPMIAASARLGLVYAEKLLKDVTADQFARFAMIGDTVIESNHPCFAYGHLSLYAPRIIEQLGGDTSGFAVPDGFEAVFSKDAKCVDDATGRVYPEMETVTNALFDGYRGAIDILESTSDDAFVAENPNEIMRERFPTIGAMHAFYVSGHFMLHMGQVSAWRRAVGLGPA